MKANPLNVENRSLFHADNLDVLRGINSNSIHLIATDPPFNKNRDFHATPASLASGASFQDRWSWEKDVHQEWVDQITDDHPKLMEAIESARYAHSDGMGAYMCFMAVRLLEMRRVLREDGSVYLHCDPTASHYLKAVMDAIFGYKNFRNEIVWRRIRAAKASQHVSKSWGRSSDTILYYVVSNKTGISPYRKLSPEEILTKFDKVDAQGRRYYDDSAHIFRPPGLGARPNLCYRWRGFENPHPSGWTLSKDRLEEEYRKGNFVITPDGKLERRKYQDDYQGMPLDNVWIDIPAASGKERLGYPTQKPLALYERIIRASSNECDIVLDPFCGCATTLVAAERLNRQWIGIDIWDKAHETVIRRLQDEGLAAPDGDTGGRLFTAGQIAYSKEPPVRTDEGEEAAPHFQTVTKRSLPAEAWQKFSRAQMTEILKEGQQYQKDAREVICAGCGRILEPEFMELDHIQPRADNGANDISNRILLCRPCNGRKSNQLTLSGLIRANKKAGWMSDEDMAKKAQASAKNKYEEIRYGPGK